MEKAGEEPLIFSSFQDRGDAAPVLFAINKSPSSFLRNIILRAINKPWLLMEGGLCFFKGPQVVKRDNRADDEINTV